ncbi:MAG: hypothetical protein MI685_10820 [Chlorobiales bacterium]|nr:hypothetical protein [Chlorobiales bacterium]
MLIIGSTLFMPAAPPPPDFSSENKDMPDALKRELRKIYHWADDNKKESRRDELKFWALKLPATLIAASSGITSHFDISLISTILASIASVLVVIDGVVRPGKLRDLHHYAHFELCELADEVSSEWSKEVLNGVKAENTIATELMEKIKDQKRRISKYLKQNEAPLFNQ